MSDRDPSAQDPIHELAPAYAIDALPSEEQARFEAHLSDCPSCRAEVTDLREVAAELAAAESVEPPPELRARVLADIARTEQDRSPSDDDGEQRRSDSRGEPVVDLGSRRPRRLAALALSAAAVIVVAGLSIAVLRGDSELDQLVANPDAIRTELDGDIGRIEIVWSPDDDRVAILADGLPEAGPGLTYALWFVLEDGVAPAALFNPRDGTFREVMAVDDVAAAGWGVTIEPETGSPQPTGEILHVGTLSSA